MIMTGSENQLLMIEFDINKELRKMNLTEFKIRTGMTFENYANFNYYADDAVIIEWDDSKNINLIEYETNNGVDTHMPLLFWGLDTSWATTSSYKPEIIYMTGQSYFHVKVGINRSNYNRKKDDGFDILLIDIEIMCDILKKKYGEVND